VATLLALLAALPAALADETFIVTSAMTEDRPSDALLDTETGSLEPLFGMIGYTDATEQPTARAALGAILTLNVSGALPGDAEMTFLGLQTAAIYGPGLLEIPANLVIGWSMARDSRVSLHGGAMALYRPDPSAVDLGGTPDEAARSWRVFPNLGFDFQYALSRDVAVNLRPDWTFATDVGVVTTTLSLIITLGA
jgi:hypothetical protein